MKDGDTVFDTWIERDFELMAKWYGVDADELIDETLSTGAFESLHDRYVSDCWEAMEEAAVALGGTATEQFDFVEASTLFGSVSETEEAARFLPGLDEATAARFDVVDGALLDAGGHRFELALVSEGWEFFVCPDLPDDARVVEGELVASGRPDEPAAFRAVVEGAAAAADYRAYLDDYATLDLRPDFVSAATAVEAQAALASDPYLMHRHDANRPDSRDVEFGPSPKPAATSAPVPTARELEGFPMTDLLKEAYLASEGLGPTPTDAALKRYERAMSELDRREAASAAVAPAKDTQGYLSAALDAYRQMTGWQGLTAEEALECFVADLSAGRIPVGPPEPDHLELATPIGTLVASTAMSYEDSRVIEVSLEKPDGTSGQVAMVEVVSGDLAEGYVTPLHTFCWDGNEECPGTVVDCDHGGEYMQYTGYSHGRPTPDAVRDLLDEDAFKRDPSELAMAAKERAKATVSEEKRGPRLSV